MSIFPWHKNDAYLTYLYHALEVIDITDSFVNRVAMAINRDLHDNGFTGPIPKELSQLDLLQNL